MKYKSKIKVSRFPRLVWKVINGFDQQKHPDIWCSVYKHQEFPYNKVVETEIKIEIEHLDSIHAKGVVRHGFHAFKSLWKARKYYKGWDMRRIVPCIVPKNSEYCLTSCFKESDEIVSSKIIVFRNLKELFKHLKSYDRKNN